MSHEQRSSLTYMANQIADNLRHGASEDVAIEQIYRHIEKFWARPMKRRIIADLGEVSEELNPLARRAIERLAAKRYKLS